MAHSVLCANYVDYVDYVDNDYVITSITSKLGSKAHLLCRCVASSAASLSVCASGSNQRCQAIFIVR
eukprot:748246-Pyramimonas_sp.AAC.1